MYQKLKEIYDYFEDQESGFIFRQRLLYALTGEWIHIRNLLLYYRDEKAHNILNIIAEPDKFQRKELVLFGTGSWGGKVADILTRVGIEFHCYCDNNRARIGKKLRGKEVISVDELLSKHKDAWILVATELYEDEIVDQLCKAGIEEERILRMTFRKEIQYMDNELMAPQSDEVFVDAGCYDGRTSLDFLKWAGQENVKRIYAFEPDAVNHTKCQQNLGKVNNTEIELVNAGLWSSNTTLHFNEEHHAGSKFDSNGSVSVPVVNLDSIVGDANVSFIKMDIEGSELEALKGAADVIQRCRPRMAICVYHKPEDIIEIPKLIKEFVPEYHLTLRHYMPNELDTILYATCERR